MGRKRKKNTLLIEIILIQRAERKITATKGGNVISLKFTVPLTPGRQKKKVINCTWDYFD